jgi:preprotein translocase subunit SecA
MWVALQSIYPIRIDLSAIDRETITREDLLDRIFDDAISSYEAREKEWGEELTRNLERWIVLQVLDVRWREHLDNMDYMRQGIGLRGYAQKDPLVEYRAEGAAMFNEMDFLVKQETVRALMHVEVQVEDQGQYDHSPQNTTQQYSYEHDQGATLEALAAAGAQDGGMMEEAEAFPVVEQRHVDPDRDIGRNDPCWCGSGKKFKKCHGA